MPGPFGDTAWVFYYSRLEIDNARSLALAEGVVRAQPNAGASYFYLGSALQQAGRPAEALAAFRRVREIDPLEPSSAQNEITLLALLRRVDEWQAALTLAQAARGGATRSTPRATERFRLTGELPATLNARGDLNEGYWLWLQRRFPEVLKTADTGLADKTLTDPNRLALLGLKCNALRRLNRVDEAVAVGRLMLPIAEKLAAAPALDPTAALRWPPLALLFAGRPDEAIAAGRRYVNGASPTNQVLERWQRERTLAELYAGAGRPRECVELLAKLLRVPGGLTVPMLRVDPDWDPVRDDPAFKALLADPKNSAPL